MKAAIVLQPLLGITNILQIAFNPYNVGNNLLHVIQKIAIARLGKWVRSANEVVFVL